MRYFFPLHFDGGNRGCEGIAKGTAVLLGEPKDKLIGYCRNVALDSDLGIDEYVSLIPYFKVGLFDKIQKQLEAIIYSKRSKSDLYFKYEFRKFLDMIGPEDVMISTGGDMLCYGNNMVITTNDMLRDRGIKTVLWGCSMGERNYTPEKHETLKRFSLIYARESLTYNYLKSLGLTNLVCLPDPAFVLSSAKVELPHCFIDNDVIGINLSPFVVKGDSIENSSFVKDLYTLFEFLLHETNYHILMIPHVLWNNQDDRVVSNYLFDKYRQSGRISVLDSTKLNYQEIRYIISKCKLFIGARTHAVISAYSSCVPTLALGYSIKAQGIAKDLGLDPNLVVDTTDHEAKRDLVLNIQYLIQNQSKIKKHLERSLPEYKNRVFAIRDYIKTL